MRVLHIVLFALITFCWIWALPLLLLGSFLLAGPCCLGTCFCFFLTFYLQLRDDGLIIPNHWLRRFISSIPWNDWFPCNQLTFKSGVVSVHPHGILCCGTLAGIHFVPGSTTCLCIAPVVFYIPVIGWVARLLGCIPSDLKHMRLALDSGHPVLVVPGGVPEIVLAETGDDHQRFKRHGFLRLAKDTGHTLHAVTVKGECSTYNMFQAPFIQARVWLSWRFNIPFVFPLMLGWYGTWIPKRVPLTLSFSRVEQLDVDFYAQLLEQMYKK